MTNESKTPPGMEQQRLVHLGLFAVQVFFGVHYLAAKLLLEEIPPRAWAPLRVGGGALVLLAASRLSGQSLPRKPGDLGRFALFALFGVGLNQVLFVEGLARTTPTHASLIVTTIPVATLLIAALLGRERLGVLGLLAPAIAFGGVVLVVRPDGGDAVVQATLLGDLLILGNSLSFSLFLVLSKPLLSRIAPLPATAVLLSFGAIWISIAGFPELLAFDFTAVSTVVWWLAVYIVLLPTAAAYLIQSWALGKIDSSIVALFIYLQPVIAAGLSFVFLGERPGLSELAGATLIFAGVFLALRKATR